MARYTNGTETVDAMFWAGDFAAVTTFLHDNPPILDPKVLEDNPNALGVVEIDGTLRVFTSGGYETVGINDALIRGADLRLRGQAHDSFVAEFALVP